MLKNYWYLLRPHQWLKNLFVFIPLFFSRHLFDVPMLGKTMLAFFAFCLAASSIYCLNDIHDREADSMHPKKMMRPIASGRVSVVGGYCMMSVCLILAVALSLIVNSGVLFLVLSYFVMNTLYCVCFKEIALVDVTVIAVGFVLRIFVGGSATGIAISQWLVLMTFLLALFLAFAKRRDDVLIYEHTGEKPRHNINRYSLAFVNLMITFIGSITIVCYIMYTVSDEVVKRFHNTYIYLTTVFVLLGIVKYMQLTVVDQQSGSPTQILLHNRFIQACVIGWIVSFLLIIYV
jgi:4-hydroxybenzoate polyprenyltransferase